mmetsp:Transcript_19373/g.39216  ORF Transcript_19373/g.39216 Transcript_19373/m.39216 type:complete len:245 (-) Transcript_19373:116-850(-)
MVFSGIVQEIGEVVSFEEKDDVKMWDGKVSKGTVMRVQMKKGLVDAYVGCSIAINGVCLTATSFDEKSAVFGLAPETLRRSNLRFLKAGDPVNVEPSLKGSDRNSGHYVQGHVDGTGTIVSKEKDGESLRIRIGNVPANLMDSIVEKGYIAVDGTSLTITAVNPGACWFEFMLVAHTQSAVIIPQKNIGEHVNIEADVMAKYASRAVKSAVKGIEAQIFNLKCGVAILGSVLLATLLGGKRLLK